MTKGSLIEYQALKIAQLEQEVESLGCQTGTFTEHHPLELKRFVISDKMTGAYVATVYAEEFRPYNGVNSFTGAHGGHFYIGETVVGSVELAQYRVDDSTGRMQAKHLRKVA